ncbi:hypothetical protein ASE65_16105 [Sphingomonas sp. Leaf16]|nr:hypothetical protein ASE65_16105 [Sphingomonas sp. Leaf16]KQN16905.1 hypothetical protein ASE81_16155 [Sphingomonas sp. Leaf29]
MTFADRLHIEVRHPPAPALPGLPSERTGLVEIDADDSGERLRPAPAPWSSAIDLHLPVSSTTIRRAHQVSVRLRPTRQQRPHMVREDGLFVRQARTGHALQCPA